MKFEETLKKGNIKIPGINKIYDYDLSGDYGLFSIRERTANNGYYGKKIYLEPSEDKINPELDLTEIEEYLKEKMKLNRKELGIDENEDLDNIEFGHIPKEFAFNEQPTTDCLVYSVNEKGEYQYILGNRMYPPFGLGLLGGMVEQGEEQNNSLENMQKELNEEANIEIEKEGLEYIGSSNQNEIRGRLVTEIYTKKVKDVNEYVAGSDMTDLKIVSTSELLELMTSYTDTTMVPHHKKLIETITYRNKEIGNEFEREKNEKDFKEVQKQTDEYLENLKQNFEEYKNATEIEKMECLEKIKKSYNSIGNYIYKMEEHPNLDFSEFKKLFEDLKDSDLYDVLMNVIENDSNIYQMENFLKPIYPEIIEEIKANKSNSHMIEIKYAFFNEIEKQLKIKRENPNDISFSGIYNKSLQKLESQEQIEEILPRFIDYIKQFKEVGDVTFMVFYFDEEENVIDLPIIKTLKEKEPQLYKECVDITNAYKRKEKKIEELTSNKLQFFSELIGVDIDRINKHLKNKEKDEINFKYLFIEEDDIQLTDKNNSIVHLFELIQWSLYQQIEAKYQTLKKPNYNIEKEGKQTIKKRIEEKLKNIEDTGEVYEIVDTDSMNGVGGVKLKDQKGKTTFFFTKKGNPLDKDLENLEIGDKIIGEFYDSTDLGPDVLQIHKKGEDIEGFINSMRSQIEEVNSKIEDYLENLDKGQVKEPILDSLQDNLRNVKSFRKINNTTQKMCPHGKVKSTCEECNKGMKLTK